MKPTFKIVFIIIRFHSRKLISVKIFIKIIRRVYYNKIKIFIRDIIYTFKEISIDNYVIPESRFQTFNAINLFFQRNNLFFFHAESSVSSCSLFCLFYHAFIPCIYVQSYRFFLHNQDKNRLHYYIVSRLFR